MTSNIFVKSILFFTRCFDNITYALKIQKDFSGIKSEKVVSYQSETKIPLNLGLPQKILTKTLLKWMIDIIKQAYLIMILMVCTSVATKLRRSSKLRRFLSEDPSSSSSSVHFQLPKNLQSFEDFRPKIAKILWKNIAIFWTKLSEKFQKYVLFLKH